MTPFFGNMRRNLALIVAFFSLGASALGWYSSYTLIVYRVEVLEKVADENKARLESNKRVLDAHVAAVLSHLDERTWKLLMEKIEDLKKRLEEIDKQVRTNK